MKKTFFIGGMMFLILGLELPSSVTSVKAETLFGVKQIINNSTTTSRQVSENQVELLNSGTGAKQKLRFQPQANFQQSATMTVKTDLATSIGGKPVSSFKQPAIVITLQTKVTKIDSNGDIHYEFSYSDVDLVDNTNLPPQVLDKLRSQMQKLVGLKGSAIVDNYGKTKKANLVLPTGLDPSLKQSIEQFSNSLDQFSSPLPQQAVGVGARWRVNSNLNMGGMNFRQITTYQLVNLTKGVATLKINVEQIAPSQKLTIPGLPQGVTLNLNSYKGMGQGQAIVPLNKLLPTRSSMSLLSNTDMTQKKLGSPEETRLNQEMSMEMIIESK